MGVYPPLMYHGGGMILRVLPRAKLMVVMLDLPCHDMYYCVVLWCEVYYVIV